MSGVRDMTVGELREALAEYPDHWAVLPIVDGTEGIITALRARPTRGNDETLRGPAVWIGEIDIPPHLQESVIERAREVSR